MAENTKIEIGPEFSDPDLIRELTAEEPATADGFTPMEPEPVEKIEVYKIIGDERIKMDEEEVTVLGADGVADAVYRVAQGLMTKDGLAKHLLNRRDVRGRDRARLLARIKTAQCEGCLKLIGRCIRRDDEEEYASEDGRYFGLSGAFIKQIQHGNRAYYEAKDAIFRVYDKLDNEEFDRMMDEADTPEPARYNPELGHLLLAEMMLTSMN